MPPQSRRPKHIAPAIHPNEGVRAWYERELDKIVSDIYVDTTRKILAVFAEIKTPIIVTDAPSKNPSVLIRRALDKWGGLWTRRLDKLSLDLSREFARRNFTATQISMRESFKKAGFTVTFQPTPASVEAYQAVVGWNTSLIKSIPKQYLTEIESKIWSSVMAGGDMHTLAKGLQKSYKVTKERAALIARDQNAKAKATIERTRRKELGITKAVWQHSSGGKVPRATHIAMDGKPYEIAQGMYDSDEGKYVLPGELINCRCTSKAVLPFLDASAVAARVLASRPNELFTAAAARAKVRRPDRFKTPI